MTDLSFYEESNDDEIMSNRERLCPANAGGGEGEQSFERKEESSVGEPRAAETDDRHCRLFNFCDDSRAFLHRLERIPYPSLPPSLPPASSSSFPLRLRAR